MLQPKASTMLHRKDLMGKYGKYNYQVEVIDTFKI